MSCSSKKVEDRYYYNYYDSPDGCDIDKKVVVTTRYGVIAGIWAGTYDVLMYSHAIGLGNILKRYAIHVIPLGLMGATFAAVANGVQIMRKKDDKLNYFLGGAACGPILSWYVGSLHGLVAGGFVLGMAAMVKKEAIDSNVTLFPDFPNHMNLIDSWRNDYTLAADPRDSWKHTCGLDDEPCPKSTQKSTSKSIPKSTPTPAPNTLKS